MHAIHWLWPALALILATPVSATTPAQHDARARLALQARAVTITRDDWGIPHVYGKTDADAVFGMIYAQCEDDFSRVQANLLAALGWSARAQGKAAIWADLRQQLWVDPAQLKQKYAASPAWLQKLMVAWADGLNWYLATHPKVHPVITHYAPWMALSFTEGSIGGDITRVNLAKLAAFYGADTATTRRLAQTRPTTWIPDTGSNGIAIAPRLTTAGHALLLINPHVTFNFRTESHMRSDEGLDAYGASTWGQFFIYQGFNRHVGWMHTSTGMDAVDQYHEQVKKHGDGYRYRYGEQWLPIRERNITIDYRQADGSLAQRQFTAYFTNHGPVVAGQRGQWLSTALMDRPIAALKQSWLRTKTHDLASYMQVAKLKANSSNNTLFADDQGEIAFLMPQFIPGRDNRFDYLQPVDGTDPATAWQGMTPLMDMPNVTNPPNGWVMNTNDAPWSAAGKYSPKVDDYPRYMDSFGENPRGKHATALLTDAHAFTPAKLIATAWDPYLPAFARLLPILLDDYDNLPASDPRKARLAGPIGVLRQWDYRWGLSSIATTLAVVWGDGLWNRLATQARASGLNAYRRNMQVLDYMANQAGASVRLQALVEATDRLQQDFGHWGVPWGAFNRYQRLDDAITPHFDDSKPSLAVPFTSSRWGSLASFSAHRQSGTDKYYGTNGNSFVAVVEFGPRVHARAIHVGGQSGTPGSAHFTDQMPRYINGNLRTVYFWPDELAGHIARHYHPGLPGPVTAPE